MNVFLAIVFVFSVALAGCDGRKPTETKADTSDNLPSVTPSAQINQRDTSSVTAFDPVEIVARNLKANSNEKRLAAVDELAKIGSPRAVEALASFIATLPDDDFKEEVVRRSSLVTNRECIPTVLGLISTTKDAGVLRVSQLIFVNLADANSLQSVLDAYDSSTDPVMRDRLAKSISYISNENTVPVLMQILSDASTSATDGIVRASAQALRQIGTAPAVDALIERINSEKSEESRSVLAVEVGRVTNSVAETSLQTAAKGDSKTANTPDARTAAIWALLNYPSAETREELKLLQSDSNSQVSFAAREVLKTIEIRLSTP